MRKNMPLVAWLGDDFTGSAAVMEVLHFAGIPSVLFTDAPSPACWTALPMRGGLASPPPRGPMIRYGWRTTYHRCFGCWRR